MKPILSPMIIGAGGVASYLLPVLIKSFELFDAKIWDGDTLEERNLDRQLFSPVLVGRNKAQALVATLEADIEPVTMYFNGHQPHTGCNVIICVADNNTARKNAIEAAEAHKLPCILGGNEYFDAEAMLFLPHWAGSPKDPRVAHPEILTDRTGNPLSCQGAAQEASPQLAIANDICASFILHMLWVLFTASEDELAYIPHEIQRTRWSYTYKK